MSNDAQLPVNPFAAQQLLLIEQLSVLLAPLDSVLQVDVVHVLKGTGKLLSQPHLDVNPAHPVLPAGVWSLLTLLIAQYVSPDVDPLIASSVAIAVECFVCALDLLDDIEDEDQTPVVQELGAARVLNVSTALLTLTQRAILSLSQQEIAPTHILRLLNTLQESALVATAGQHRDLLAEQRSAQDLTREECIEIARAKAGSIMRLAFRMGALCAGADDALCEQFSELGELLGIAHQLDNDCHDLYDLLRGETIVPGGGGTTNVKTDLVRRKKTLPVVLAVKGDSPLQKRSGLSDEEKKEYLQALHEGIIATWGICLLYRERARDRLGEIEAQKLIAPELRLLLGFG
jgi:geranylgeranyl pyrophosphate synthase